MRVTSAATQTANISFGRLCYDAMLILALMWTLGGCDFVSSTQISGQRPSGRVAASFNGSYAETYPQRGACFEFDASEMTPPYLPIADISGIDEIGSLGERGQFIFGAREQDGAGNVIWMISWDEDGQTRHERIGLSRAERGGLVLSPCDGEAEPSTTLPASNMCIIPVAGAKTEQTGRDYRMEYVDEASLGGHEAASRALLENYYDSWDPNTMLPPEQMNVKLSFLDEISEDQMWARVQRTDGEIGWAWTGGLVRGTTSYQWINYGPRDNHPPWFLFEACDGATAQKPSTVPVVPPQTPATPEPSCDQQACSDRGGVCEDDVCKVPQSSGCNTIEGFVACSKESGICIDGSCEVINDREEFCCNLMARLPYDLFQIQDQYTANRDNFCFLGPGNRADLPRHDCYAYCQNSFPKGYENYTHKLKCNQRLR